MRSLRCLVKMKIFVCCSKYFYDKIHEIKEELEKMGHTVILPNSYEDPFKEEKIKEQDASAHINWKANMLRTQEEKVKQSDILLVLNFEKKGQPNYVGGATFLEIFKAFELGKRIYLFNPIPDNIFKDELISMSPIVLNGDLLKLV